MVTAVEVVVSYRTVRVSALLHGEISTVGLRQSDMVQESCQPSWANC